MTNSNKMIGISEQTKNSLDLQKVHPRETYNDVIERITKDNDNDTDTKTKKNI